MDEVGGEGFGGGVFALGGSGRPERAKSGNESGIAASTDWGGRRGAGGAVSGGEPDSGQKKDGGGFVGARAENPVGEGGGKVERAESEGEAELGSDPGASGGQKAAG